MMNSVVFHVGKDGCVHDRVVQIAKTTRHLTCIVSLPACKNHVTRIYRTTFILALNAAENIPHSENIVVVLFTYILLPAISI